MKFNMLVIRIFSSVNNIKGNISSSMGNINISSISSIIVVVLLVVVIVYYYSNIIGVSSSSDG